MSSRAGRTPFGLVALILAITVVPLSILLWLGWRVVTQERTLERQQVEDQAKIATDVVVAALQESVATTERQVAAGAKEWPAGAAMVTIRDDGLTVAPPHALAFYPVIDPLPEPPPPTFGDVDVAEFRDKDMAEARRLLEALGRDANRTIRANAIFRLAGVEARASHRELALRRYEQLLAIDDVGVNGEPVSLLAQWARCRILDDTRDRASLKIEAERLLQDLQAGRWILTEPGYRLYAGDAARWLDKPTVPATEREVLARAVARLWADRSLWSPNSRESLSIGDQLVTVLKVKAERFPRALVATDGFVHEQWLPRARALADKSGLRLTIGAAASPGPGVDLRLGEQTRMPWPMAFTRQPGAPDAVKFESRRRQLLAGLAVLVVMALIAAYVIVRAVNREIAVARLQSDFVAAVSHEFRTPLTALRQFTGMLNDGTAANDDTRQICYDAQSRATDRLTRLVESVLDFGRMEAGAKPYHFEVHDCADIVGGVVEDFRRDARAKGYRIEFQSSDAARIEVDREALSRAVWNLLDNAIKYSPGRQLVEVALGRRPDGVSITVRDYGIGVPPQERQAIFERFSRGGEAQARGINGTGIGLSMVDHIVRAHRGRIELESEVGEGSRFTLILPTRV